MDTTDPRCPQCDDANISATVEFAGSETVSIEDELAEPEGFNPGAVWAFRKMAAWLEITSFVADNEAAQRAVDNTKKLIAEQARQAADKLRDR